MVRRALVAGLVGLAACNADPGGGHGGDTDTAGDADNTAPIGVYGSCIAVTGGDCESNLECVSLGARSYCLRPCTLPAGFECTGEERCVDEGGRGVCLRRAGHWEPCGLLSTCGADAYCRTADELTDARCIPICDVGNVAGKEAVTDCPDAPAELTDQPVSCTPITFGSDSLSLCAAEVAVGEVCDEIGLRCDPDDTRPDTDEDAEAGGPGENDPGALACLPAGDTSRCVRVCSTDGGNTTAPCACPAADPACADPADPGLTWSCEGWDEVDDELRRCVPLETCTNDTPCSDNTDSGLTVCRESPFTTVSGKVCVR